MKHKLLCENNDYRLYKTDKHTIIAKPKTRGIKAKMTLGVPVDDADAKEILNQITQLINSESNHETR